jgi:hypothetical protein
MLWRRAMARTSVRMRGRTPEPPRERVSGQSELLDQQQASRSIWRGRYLAPVIAAQSSLSSAVRLAMVI